MLQLQPKIPWWRVSGIELLDIRHLPIDVWQQFSNLIELWSCTTASTISFFYTKIHESLTSGVTKGWIKVLLLPFAPTEIPSVQLNISNEGIIHPRSHTTKPRKVELMAGIFNFVLEKCSLQSVQMCFIFLHCLPPHMSHSRGEANRVYSPFYVQLRDLLTQFNYETFPKWH